MRWDAEGRPTLRGLVGNAHMNFSGGGGVRKRTPPHPTLACWSAAERVSDAEHDRVVVLGIVTAVPWSH